MSSKLVIRRKNQVAQVCCTDVVHFKRCANPECARPFKVSRLIGQASGLTDIGKLVCPHCGSHMKAEANSIYVAQAMSASEESGFASWTLSGPGKG
jgi:hypothetical protein